MPPPSDDDEFEDEFETHVQRQRVLIEKGRREKGRSFWQYVGLIGAVGFSVVVPMALATFLGHWIDRRSPNTSYEWTLSLLVLGLALGCYNAWRIVTKEH